MSNSSIWPIDRTLSGANTPGVSGTGSNGNGRVLCIPQSSIITGTSHSDCLVSYTGRGLTPLQRSRRWILYPQLTGLSAMLCCFFKHHSDYHDRMLFVLKCTEISSLSLKFLLPWHVLFTTWAFSLVWDFKHLYMLILKLLLFPMRDFHTSFNLWLFTDVWVSASLFRSAELHLIF